MGCEPLKTKSPSLRRTAESLDTEAGRPIQFSKNRTAPRASRPTAPEGRPAVREPGRSARRRSASSGARPASRCRRSASSSLFGQPLPTVRRSWPDPADLRRAPGAFPSHPPSLAGASPASARTRPASAGLRLTLAGLRQPFAEDREPFPEPGQPSPDDRHPLADRRQKLWNDLGADIKLPVSQLIDAPLPVSPGSL